MTDERQQQSTRSMDDVFEDLNSDVEPSLYNNLAPLYDAMWTGFYEYDDQFDRVAQFAPDECNRIIEFGCGTGRTLQRLTDEYDDVTGVDVNNGVAEIARGRAPEATIVVADAADYEAPEPVDCMASLGYCLGGVPPAAIPGMFEQCYENLRNGGRIVIDHLDEDADDGGFDESHGTHEGYEITIRCISDVQGREEAVVNSYMVEDVETGERAQGGETLTWYQHPTDYLVAALRTVGFDVRVETGEGEEAAFGNGVVIVGEK